MRANKVGVKHLFEMNFMTFFIYLQANRVIDKRNRKNNIYFIDGKIFKRKYFEQFEK